MNCIETLKEINIKVIKNTMQCQWQQSQWMRTHTDTKADMWDSYKLIYVIKVHNINKGITFYQNIDIFIRSNCYPIIMGRR